MGGNDFDIFIERFSKAFLVDQILIINMISQVGDNPFNPPHHLLIMKNPVEQFILNVLCKSGPVRPHKFKAGEDEFLFPLVIHHADISLFGAFAAPPEGREEKTDKMPLELDLQV